MPYIEKHERVGIAATGQLLTAGQLNYALTRVVQGYVEQHGLRYQTINDVVGALEGAKAEFQRRVVAPYEDSKIKQNGDVYDSAQG
jgi:hypothetical protein